MGNPQAKQTRAVRSDKALVPLAMTMMLGIVLVGVCSQASAAELIRKETSQYGTTYWGRFDHAPFPSPGSPYKDNTIAVFVPEHYCPVLIKARPRKKGQTLYSCYSEKQWAKLKKSGYRLSKVDAVDYVIHFHGHSNTVEKALNNHKLREQFSLSLQNAILVVPQGPVNAIDSSAGKLERSGGMKRMLTEVHHFLRKQGVIGSRQHLRRLIITSHSGGYRAAENCLKHGGFEVSELFLFDSLYAGTETFFEWIKEGKGRRLVNIYYRDKPRARTRELGAMLASAGIPVLKLKESEMDKPDFQRKKLARSRVIFVETDLGHSGCTRGRFNYRDHLFGSGLRRIRKTDWFKKTGLDKLELP